MKPTREDFECQAGRVGDTLVVRRPPKFRKPDNATVHYLVTSLEPFHCEPVEMVRLVVRDGSPRLQRRRLK